MKENIEDYKKDGFIDLDEYLKNNPEGITYPYYLNGYGKKNFWTRVGKDDEEKFIYVKPKNTEFLNDEYSAYAELIYAELLKQVGIETVDYDVAKYDGNYATISENMLDNYSKNQFLISGDELIYNRKYGVQEENNIEDLFDAIHEYCIAQNLSKDIEDKCISDIQKQCIADIFTLSTDRSPTDFDFVAGRDKDDEEQFFLAPSCHNTYALGSTFSKDEIIEMLEDYDNLSKRIDLCYIDAGVPEYKRDYDCAYWEDSLYYFIDEDEENLEFAKKCAERLNIDNAIKNVEKKIKSRIPEEYKLFMRQALESRLREICKVLSIDYYRVLDNRYYEMEER